MTIKTILAKGRLTGEEVGRLLLRDFVRALGATPRDQTPPGRKFTDAEKQALVNKLVEPRDIQQYNAYAGVLRFLQKIGILYLGQRQQLQLLLLVLHQQLNQARNIEAVRLLLGDAPAILTEKQYQKLKKDGEGPLPPVVGVIPEAEIQDWDEEKRERYLDPDGNYRHQLAPHERQTLAETLPSVVEAVKNRLRVLLAIREIYRTLGEATGEESIADLAIDVDYLCGEADAEELVGRLVKAGALAAGPAGIVYALSLTVLNKEIESLKRQLSHNSPVVAPATVKEIHRLVSALPEINIEELEPQKEALDQVRRLARDLNVFETNGLRLVEMLAGEL